MHKAEATRAANLSKEEQAKLKLPGDTHIVSGTLEGHGATALVSAEGELDAKIIKLARTAGGGIEYQFAIFVEEPEPETPVAPPTDDDVAVAYLVTKGQTETQAQASVAKYSAKRILAKKAEDEASQAKALDAELDEQLGLAPKAEAKTETKPAEKKDESIQ